MHVGDRDGFTGLTSMVHTPHRHTNRACASAATTRWSGARSTASTSPSRCVWLCSCRWFTSCNTQALRLLSTDTSISIHQRRRPAATSASKRPSAPLTTLSAKYVVWVNSVCMCSLIDVRWASAHARWPHHTRSVSDCLLI